MRKWMFNDRCELTTDVISGVKTKTRRDGQKVYLEHKNARFNTYDLFEYALKVCPIKVGDIVAVAQSYRTLIEQGYLCRESDGWVREEYCVSPGFRNKMFVKPELMPYKVRVTDIGFERLQDISDEDCLAEGIYERHDVINSNMEDVKCFTFPNTPHIYATPRDAFAALIDKVSGKGTWERNHYVYVYTFKLVEE